MVARNPAHFGFWILDFRLSEKDFEGNSFMCLFSRFSIQNRQSKIQNYLISLSARASTLGGIVRPICLVALRLITNSNFFGCSIGRSAGLAPLRILST